VNARKLVIIATLLVVVACSKPDVPKSSPEPAQSKISFVNTVWAVAQSKQVELGSLRVFLSDGTLVMTSPNAKPAFGSWRQDGHRLTITEEGLDYDVDVLELTHDAFRVRMHNPGEPVEILFKPATAENIP
jgi:hypothetical protein